MTLGVRIIKKSRKHRWCDECRSSVLPGEPCVRFYGAAEPGDPLYMLFAHLQCVERYTEPKLTLALRQYYGLE